MFNTFAAQTPATNGCPHFFVVCSTRLLRKRQPQMAVRTSLRCVISQLESAVGIHFRRGKAEVSRLLADGASSFILLSTRQRLE